MNIQHGIVDIISPHITALLQVMTNDFPQYNMRLITTKCLNTGIMIAFSLLGQKGLQLVDQCDSNLTTKRHKEGIENNVSVLKQLKKNLTSKREKKSKLYYILLSDGYFAQDVKNSKYFPGHVILIEKHFDRKTQKHVFRLHQSYINKYNLTQFNSVANKTISMENINNILFGLNEVITSPYWTSSNVKIWMKLTNVDTSNLINSSSGNKFFLCFRKAELKKCVSALHKYVKSKLLELATKSPHLVYGDSSLYIDNSIALTNSQIENELMILLQKIEQHERICFKHYNE